MKKSKWDVLKVIADHEGRMTWYPIDTFFPFGSIIEEPDANGMDVVGDFIAAGLIDVVKCDGSADRFLITVAGQKELESHKSSLTTA